MAMWNKLLVLVIVLCVLTACGENVIIASTVSVPIPTIMPPDWKYVSGQEMETDDDGKNEWVVFFRFDMTCDGSQPSCPISGVVYRRDDERPPNLTPYRLYPPDRSYLCECQCSAEMKNVLTGIPGDELVIRDKCSGRITRLAIFNWDTGQDEYLPRGLFAGYCIEIGENEVEVRHRLQDRAQLMMLLTYHPLHNQAYYEPGGYGALVAPAKYEYSFCPGEPEHVTLSPYPEKVVLAFYAHYNEDEEKVTEYFTEGGWEYVEECEHNRCGCTVPRKDVKHVRVTDLMPKLESEEPEKAEVEAEIVCERLDDKDDGHAKVTWSLVQEENRWKLDRVTVTPVQ